MKTTRRGFFALLASAAITTAADTTRLGLTLRSVLPDRELSLIELLEARIRATEKMMAQQLTEAIYGDGIIAFYSGYDLLEIKPAGKTLQPALRPAWDDAPPEFKRERYALSQTSIEILGP